MELKLVDKKPEARDTVSFYFKPEKEVIYLPGQYLYLILPKLNYPDLRGLTRQFTISSSPTEPDNLMFTTRIRKESGFKRTLDELAIGETITGEGPHGVFTPDFGSLSASNTNIFIAGGIGITPFRSILKYAFDNKLDTKIHLIYSNSDSEFVFKKELNNWQPLLNLNIDYVDTSLEGRVDKSKIEKLLVNAIIENRSCTFWLSGPPAFVNSMEEILNTMGILSENIKTDKFTGY